MADGRLSYIVDIEAPTGQAIDSVDALEQRLKGLAAAEKSAKAAGGVLADLKADIDKIGASVDAATAKGADLASVTKNVAQAGGMIASAWETADQINGRVSASVKRLNDEYTALGKVANEAMQKGTKEGDAQMRAAQSRMQAIRQEIAQYNAVQRGMEEVTGELSRQEGEYNRIKQGIDKATSATVSLRQQLRQVTEQMYAMRAAALESGGQAAVKAVMASEAYQQLAEKAANLRDIQSDVNAEMTTMANDNGTLKAVTTGVQGVAGAFAVAQGAMGLFVGESEDLQKVMMKVQSLMAVMMGLQQVVNTLNKDSALMTSIRRWRTGFEAAGAAATGAAGKLKALWAVMKANPAGIILSVLSAAAVAISKFVKKTQEAKEKLEEIKKKAEEMNSSVADAASSSVAKFLQLRAAWEQVGGSFDAKRKFVVENAEAFKNLGVQVRSVKEAENLLNKDTNAFIRAQRQRGEAITYSQMAMSKTKELLEKQELLHQKSAEAVKVVGRDAKLAAGTELKTLGKEIRTLEADIDKLYEKAEKKAKEADRTMKDNGIVPTTTTTPTTPKKDTSTDNYIREMEKKMEESAKLIEKGRKQREKEAEEQRKIEERVFADNRSFVDRRLDLDRKYASDKAIIEAAQMQDEAVRIRTLEQLRRNYLDAQKRLLQEELDDIRQQAEEKYKARMDAAESITDEQEREKSIRAVNLDILKDEKAVLSALVAMGRKDLLPSLEKVNKQIEDAQTGTEDWTDKVKRLCSYYDQIAEYVGKALDGLYETGEIAEGSKLDEWISGLSDGINSIVKGFQQGGLIGAFAGAALSLWQSLAKHVAKLNKELDETVEATKEMYRLKQQAKQAADDNAIFGYSNSFADMDKRVQYLKAYGEMMQKAQAAFMADPSNKFLEQQKLFWEEQYLNEFAGIEEAYSSIFNNIGNDIMDAMLSAADNTDEAFASLTDNIAGYVRQWVTNMLYADRVSAKMAENRERLNKAIATGDQDIINQAIKDSVADLHIFAQQLKAEKAVLDETLQGIYGELDIEGDTSTAGNGAASGMTGAVSGMSAETASLLAGQLTAMRLNAASIDEAMRQTLYHVSGIHINTDRMAADIADIKNNINYNNRVNAY